MDLSAVKHTTCILSQYLNNIMTSSSQQLHTSAVNALHCVHNYAWLNTIFGEKEHKGSSTNWTTPKHLTDFIYWCFIEEKISTYTCLWQEISSTLPSSACKIRIYLPTQPYDRSFLFSQYFDVIFSYFQKLSLKMPKRALLIFEGHFNSKDSVFIHQRFCVNTLLRMELFQSCKHLQSYRGNNRTDKRG